MSSFYGENFVRRGRKDKTCGECEKTIEAGDSSFNAIYNDEYQRVDFCVECYERITTEFEDMEEYLTSKED